MRMWMRGHTTTRLGPAFGWLWSAYAASALGAALGFGAFPLIAVAVLGAGPAGVSALAAAATAVGALSALPLGPWVETHRKRPVMIGADLLRCLALLTIPIAHLLGLLSYAHLLVVAVCAAAANIAFTAASGAYLRQLVPPGDLLVANSRFESTTWTTTAVGPALGGAAVGLFGPVVTVLANAAGLLLSALGLTAIRRPEEQPPYRRTRWRVSDLTWGKRRVAADPRLHALFRNAVVFNALLLATEPLAAVLLLGELGWAPWQYGVAFGLPCLGGLVGAQLTRRLRDRFGHRRLLHGTGVLRALPPITLALVPPGPAGVVLVLVAQFALLTCVGMFVPLLATERLRRVCADSVARVLVWWTVAGRLAVAATTALWGVLGVLAGPRVAIALAGLLLLATPLLLPGGRRGYFRPGGTSSTGR